MVTHIQVSITCFKAVESTTTDALFTRHNWRLHRLFARSVSPTLRQLRRIVLPHFLASVRPSQPHQAPTLYYKHSKRDTGRSHSGLSKLKDAVHVSLQSNCAFGFSMMSIVGMMHSHSRISGSAQGWGKKQNAVLEVYVYFLTLKMVFITLQMRITREIPLTRTTG